MRTTTHFDRDLCPRRRGAAARRQDRLSLMLHDTRVDESLRHVKSARAVLRSAEQPHPPTLPVRRGAGRWLWGTSKRRQGRSPSLTGPRDSHPPVCNHRGTAELPGPTARRTRTEGKATRLRQFDPGRGGGCSVPHGQTTSGVAHSGLICTPRNSAGPAVCPRRINLTPRPADHGRGWCF